MGKINNATSFAEAIAADDSYGYCQTHRWGNPDFDCSALVITAWEQAGVKVKTAGATYTGNMLSVFKKCGFEDVTKSVNLNTAKGMMRGDVLLKRGKHVEMYIGDYKMVGATLNENGKTVGGQSGDQTGNEIRITNYSNNGWTNILRYCGEDDSASSPSGLDYSLVFDKDFYLSKYEDLKAAFSDDRLSALGHFLSFGMNEGRTGCKLFDPVYYRALYTDLDKAFGDNWREYYIHYMVYGYTEKRNGSSSSNASIKTVKSALWLRNAANASSTKICCMPKGSKVTVMKELANGWRYVDYNGKNGYCSGRYLM